MEIFPSFDLVVDPFTRTLYWTSTNTNTINVTRLGDEDVTAIAIVSWWAEPMISLGF